MLDEVLAATKGERVAPADLWARLARRFALIGVQGIVRMAMAGFDVACWDALAIAAGVPLARPLGAPSPRIPAFNTFGLRPIAPEKVAHGGEEPVAARLPNAQRSAALPQT